MSRLISQIAGLLLLLAAPLSVQAIVQQFGATEHESQWIADGNALYCSLEHRVPLFGNVHFEQSAGGQLEMAFRSLEQPLNPGQARFLSVPPAWKHGAETRDLGYVDFRVKRPPFNVPLPLSRRVLYELEQGMFPTLSFRDWAEGADEVKVAISAVNVRDALGEFKNCLAELLPFQYEDVQYTRFNFDFNKATLKPEMKERLRDVARYLKADPEVQVEVFGHTDNRGFRSINQALGQRRAEAVRDFLVRQGVSEERFKLRSFGERKPVASNRSASGRATNRRVELELIR